MKSIRLGRTGLIVSELGFGGIPIVSLSMEQAVSVVRHCFDLGVTFFDTATMYGDSESKIGTALESVRERVVLATKTMKRDAEGAAKHLEQSLRSLRTAAIDLYQIHQIAKPETLEQVLAPGGAYEALRKARSEGKIRSVGFSSHNVQTAVQACNTGLFETVQVPFNFIEQDPAKELFRVARERDMGVIGMKPLAGGVLGRADLCFRFLQQYEAVLPIPGVKAREEMDEIVGLYRDRRPLSEAERREIERIRSELGTRFCRRCEYCLPCEQGVQVPIVLGFRGFASR
ncbi:MAG: aldo/keto reductase, partial [bacterium]